ncbi:MAG: hypothetical protein LBR28_00710, partial [Bacteroidales bacterium]|nr:hypothetical protein [Bacteroidales bacterium]
MKKAILFLASLFSISIYAQDSITLVKDGKTDYVIVIAKEHSNNILYAAELLQKDIEKVSGCKIPVVTSDKKERKKE